MAKEIERKFLVDQSNIPYLTETAPILITQGYAMLAPHQQLRVRLMNSKTYMCLKYTNDLARDEYEYEIPLKDGLEILSRCELIVEKLRRVHLYENGGNNWKLEIDEYPNGLVVAEVEFLSVSSAEAFIPPFFFSEEITGYKEYSNITLARQNLRFLK